MELIIRHSPGFRAEPTIYSESQNSEEFLFSKQLQQQQKINYTWSFELKTLN